MRVQDLSENDIIDYLMTSEFNEGMTEEEFKFLLFKFRYHYRLLYARKESIKNDVDKFESELKSLREIYNKSNERFSIEKQNLENRYNNIINRKLSWRERIKGKIIIKEDEINRI